MHARSRALFVVGAGLCAAMLAFATLWALTPKPVSIPAARGVAVASVATLRDRIPELVIVPELKGLDLEARRLRIRGLYALMGARTPRAGDLVVYLVRDDGAIRGFIGLDPRNGCDLKVENPGIVKADGAVAFHDVCHGSVYDVNGRVVGGPTPWTLDELVLDVRGGIVYADLHKVISGRLVR